MRLPSGKDLHNHPKQELALDGIILFDELHVIIDKDVYEELVKILNSKEGKVLFTEK